MGLNYTKHARERMEERGITEGHIEAAINNPDKIDLSAFSEHRLIVKKIYFNEYLARKHLLMIIYEVRKQEIIVITIIDTSKIDKYF